MKEVEDLEQEKAHVEERVAREKFRHFTFRWRIMKRVSGLKKFDRNSPEFLTASLTIQEMVKRDHDSRILIVTQELRDQLKENMVVTGDLEAEVMQHKFKLENSRRVLAHKEVVIEDLSSTVAMKDNNLRHCREKLKEKESESDLLQKDNENLRKTITALDSKNTLLTDKLNNLLNKKNISILDSNLMYGKADKKLARTRLIDEINEAIFNLNKTVT